MDLLSRIKAAQSQHGWNDGELARHLSISPSVLSRIMNGLRPLDNVRFLRAVGRALPELRWHIDEYIFGGNTQNDKPKTTASGKTISPA